MRKIYVIIGKDLDEGYKWISRICTSYKKAKETCLRLKKCNPENEYVIQTELLF